MTRLPDFPTAHPVYHTEAGAEAPVAKTPVARAMVTLAVVTPR